MPDSGPNERPATTTRTNKAKNVPRPIHIADRFTVLPTRLPIGYFPSKMQHLLVMQPCLYATRHKGIDKCKLRCDARSAIPPLLFWSPATLADFSGIVVAIHDGDTLTVLVERKQVKVRIADIDAPKPKQPFGTRSRQHIV